MDSVLAHVGRLGVEALPGWDAAATTLVDGKKVATFGSTDERVNPLDQEQYNQAAGPCVDALEGGVEYFDGVDYPERWNAFAETATKQDVRSVVSFPLKLKDQVIGAMNFYSAKKDALQEGHREEGLLFAAQAAVALANVREYESKTKQVDNLEEGLKTRTMIGQATGLLMAQEGLSSEEAFQKLVHVSQTANIKLRDIALKYVETWEQKAKTGTKS
jgi:GAF domain-containing protein